MKKLVCLFLAAVMMLTVFSALAEDLNSYTLEEIIAKAQEEGHVESVGMPDSWANWGESWQILTEKYGIAHTDDDMSSAEELNMFANDSTVTSVTSAWRSPSRQSTTVWCRATRPATGTAFLSGQRPKMACG